MKRGYVALLTFSGIAMIAIGTYGLLHKDTVEPVETVPRSDGDRTQGQPFDPELIEYVFQRYKAKHQGVRERLQSFGEEVRELVKANISPVEPSVPIALLAELRRLKNEVVLIEQWESGALPKGDYVTIMADSLVVMEYLELMGAYGKALNQLARNPFVEGVQLKGPAVLREASKRFPEIYSDKFIREWVFTDANVIALSPSATQLVPIAKALFQGSGEDTLAYRTRFFTNYANNIIKKNRQLLREMGKDAPAALAAQLPAGARTLSSVGAGIP